MELVQAAWGRYQRKMRKAPLQTKAVTAAAIQGASDVLGQLLTKPRGARLRLGKTAKMAFFGLVWVGPSIHFWQKFMEGVAFRGAPPGTPTVLRKTVFDQLTYGPVQNVAFMAWLSLVVEGQPWAATKRRIARDYPSVQVNGWKLWPLAAIVNYKYVPVPYRALFANIVALFWSTFLSLKARAGPPLLKAA